MSTKHKDRNKLTQNFHAHHIVPKHFVFTEVGGEEFARQIGMPTGSMSYCLSSGNPNVKYNIKHAWRP